MSKGKLTIHGEVKRCDFDKTWQLRLRKDLEEWIEKNIDGSKNTAVNYLVAYAIGEIDDILKSDGDQMDKL